MCSLEAAGNATIAAGPGQHRFQRVGQDDTLISVTTAELPTLGPASRRLARGDRVEEIVFDDLTFVELDGAPEWPPR